MQQDNILPIKFPGLNDSLYAGFWSRLASLILDFLISLPIIILIQYLSGLGKEYYYIVLIPNFLFIYFYFIYSVEKYGGTPGKLIVGIRVINKNGKKANTYNAWMLHFINLIISIFMVILTSIAINKIPNDIYKQLGWIQRSLLIGQQNPILIKVANWVNNIWVLSELIVLLTNERKRALHDFIGETLVIKQKYFQRLQNWLTKQEMPIISCPVCGIKKRVKKHGKYICSECATKFISSDIGTRIITV